MPVRAFSMNEMEMKTRKGIILAGALARVFYPRLTMAVEVSELLPIL